MSTGISSLQVRTAQFNKNRMIDLNHWATARRLKPEVFDHTNRVLFASKTNDQNFSKGNMLEHLFGFGKTEFVNDMTFGWKLGAQGYKGFTILENMTPALYAATPGKGRSEIRVRVDEDLAVVGESWQPGASDKSQVLKLTNKIKAGGKGYIYTLKTYTDSASLSIDPQWLTPGTLWTRFFNQRGEAAESGSSIENYGDIEFANNIGKFRKGYKVTDFGAQAKVIDIAIRTQDNQLVTSWMYQQEAMYQTAMEHENTNYALYSRLADEPFKDPDSGYPISPGAGLHQQIEFGGNVDHFTNLSVEFIEAFFDKLVFSRISPGELGEVVGWSGHYGMKAFAKALDVWNGGKSIIREGEQFFSRDPKGYHGNSLSAGYAFTRYMLPTGGSVRLYHCPVYDDKRLHREINPLTGLPKESQLITFTHVLGGNMESIGASDNIRLVRKNKVAGSTIIEGRYGPGGTISRYPTHAGDYYEYHVSDSIGVKVIDPTITGQMKPL